MCIFILNKIILILYMKNNNRETVCNSNKNIKFKIFNMSLYL